MVMKDCCPNPAISDFTCQDIFAPITIPHFFCHNCRSHDFKGRRYSKKEWDAEFVDYMADPHKEI